MKKLRLFLIFLIYIKPSFCQVVLSSEKQSNHINIPGTKVWIIPPAKFELTNRYKGFSNTTDPFSSIMLNELPAAYEKIEGTFTKTGITANNINIVEINNCSMKNAKGCKLITATQSAQGYNFKKYILLFGDDKESLMITVTFLKDSVKTGELLKNALTTLFYDDHQIVDVRGSIGYTFDESGTPFQFVNVMGTNITFAAYLDNSTEEVLFIAAKSFSSVNILNKKDFCLQRIKQLPYKNIELDMQRGLNEFEADGLIGYEIFATGLSPKESTKELIHQILLFDNDSYYLLVAMYRQPTNEKIAGTKKLAKTFRRKPTSK